MVADRVIGTNNAIANSTLTNVSLTDMNPPETKMETHSRQLIEELSRTLIAKGIETPFLLIDKKRIVNNIDRWRELLPHVTPHYAVKANVDPLVIKAIQQQGVRFDVASKYEMEVCRAIGIPADQIILSNPRKDRETLATCTLHRPTAISVDSREETEKLHQIGIPSQDYQPTLLLRIKVPTQNVVEDLNSKFGIRVVASEVTPEQVDSAALRLEELTNVASTALEAGFEKFGLAFHVGTRCLDETVYVSALQLCQRVGTQLRNWGLDLRWIDLGGGFADRTQATQTAQSSNDAPLDSLFKTIATKGRELLRDSYQLVAEPGRTLVADAGTLVSRVLFDKSTDSHGRSIQIDDGVYRTLSGCIHDQSNFQFIAFRADPDASSLVSLQSPFTVWGCSCDSFDRIATNVLLPANLKVGDLLMTPNVGAYSTSFGSNTNGFQPAKTILYWNEGSSLQWEISPIEHQNNLMIDHIRAWNLDPTVLREPSWVTREHSTSMGPRPR